MVHGEVNLSEISLIRRWPLDKRTFIGMVEAGEPLIQQAIDAMREYHQAEDRCAQPEEVERLRLLADSLYQAVIDCQLIQAGRSPSTIQ